MNKKSTQSKNQALLEQNESEAIVAKYKVSPSTVEGHATNSIVDVPSAINYKEMYERNEQRLRDISSLKEELAADLRAIKDLFIEFSKNIGLPSGDTLVYFIKNRKAIFKLIREVVTILSKKGQKI